MKLPSGGSELDTMYRDSANLIAQTGTQESVFQFET